MAVGNDKAVILIRVPKGTRIAIMADLIRQPSHKAGSEYEKRIIEKFHGRRLEWENEPAPEWIKIQDLNEDEIQLTLQNAIRLGRMKNLLMIIQNLFFEV